MAQKHMIIMRGLPGCGKTTWVRDYIDLYGTSYKRISKDDLRMMLDNGRYSAHTEEFILSARNALIKLALEQGCNPIIDDTNLNPHHIAEIKALADRDTQVEIMDFTGIPLEGCIKRDKQRDKPVGEQVIRDMWQKYLAPKEGKS